MSLIKKRKLTKNQTRRINNNASFEADDSTLATGVIVSHFGKQLDVQITNSTDDTPSIGDICRCHARTTLPMLATGDIVKISFDAIANLGRIETLMPRRTLITRPDRYHKIKPVASNIDLLVIVFAPLPKPATNLIDRYLLIAHITNTTPLLVLNKADLLCNYDDVQTIFNDYRSLGIDGVTTSIVEQNGLDALLSKISGKMSIFAGQSGVGKSSLINYLLPYAKQSTNIISKGSKLGQHTTTTSRLLPFDSTDLNQGGIIDTPGIREYGIWHLSSEHILGGFFELSKLAGECRFRDCTHNENSLGCALWSSAKAGKVLPRRIISLNELQAEAKLGKS